MRISTETLAALVAARERMGAPLVERTRVYRPDPIVWPEGTTEIEFESNDIERGPSGEILVRGRYALIYIQETGHPRALLETRPERSKKYHLYHCRTIEQMVSEGRFERYVATLRRDGLFPVHTREEDRRSERMEARLAPCINCLRLAGFEGAPGSFPLETYLASKGESVRDGPMPRTRDTDQRPVDYSRDWPQTSRRLREQAAWRCSECRVELSEPGDRRLLQVHHVNGVKSDDSPRNLRVLCVLCHDEQPKHSLNVPPADAARVRALRAEGTAAVRARY